MDTLGSHHYERLGSEKIHKLILQFSIPATTGMLVNALYNIIDRMFIGHAPDLENVGLPALTIAFPIMMIMNGIALLYGAGGAANYSIQLGAGNMEYGRKIVGTSVSMIILTSLCLSILGILNIDSLLRLFGASEVVLPYAREYMRLLFIGGIFQGLSAGCNHFMRADGSPTSSMLSMFIGAGTNIVLDYVFIYIFEWGMTGAALATIIGLSLSSVWGLSYIFFRSQLRPSLRHLIPDVKLGIKLASCGTATGFNHIGNSFLNIILNRQMGYYGGDTAVAAIGLICSLQQFIILPLTGISHGSQPIIGYNQGAGHPERVKETIRTSLLFGVIAATFLFIVTRLFPVPIIQLFTDDSALLSLGSFAVKRWFLLLPLVGFQTIGALTFQSLSKPNTALLLTFSRQFLFFIPLSLILGYFFGINGILSAAPCADSLAFLLTFLFIIKQWKKI